MPSPISASSSHRAPTRSSSAVSLARDKGRPPSPSLPQRGQSYFDRYPRPSSSPQDQHKSHEPRRPSVGRVNTEFISKPKPRRNGRTDPPDSDGDASQSFAFPLANSTQPSEVFHDGQLTPKPPSRRRSRTNSNKMSRPPPVDVSYLRTSGSSTQTQVETPPQTPVDFPVPRAFIDPFPVVVSAPISGVETMDALVDGMNGFDTDDLFAGSGGLSGRAGKKDRFHPLYQPPLPTPPPGVTLGGAMPRKSPAKPKSRNDDAYEQSLPTPTSTRRSRPSVSTRSPSSSTVTADSSFSSTTTHDVSPPASPALSRRSSKGMAPSISDIIRAYAPLEQQLRSRATSRQSSIPSSLGHTTLKEEHESEPEPLSPAEEADLLSRSSVDSIADEVRRTLENQTSTPSPQVQTGPYARSLPPRYSVVSDAAASHAFPRSDGRRSSNYSSPAAVEVPDPPIEFPTVRQTQSQSIAQYLRSARLTTLLKLTRSPHASIDNPLTVSLSDLGSPTGIPLVVFLGLGSVRYVMGLYDEMAECLGIRLITIDRWGLGRTDTPRHKWTRGIPEWASAVEEVLDLLQIERCSVMAHSAGAPYALSFANKVSERIRGEVLLLAPWVGGVEGAGYKWLKYVPNGILKTAQAAEWKIQAWMLGKPPTIAFEGIGYDASASTSAASPNRRPRSSRRRSTKDLPPDSRPSTAVSPGDAQPRPSTASSVFSEYDDLGDFGGRFDSRSTLGAKSVTRHRSASENKRPSIITRKTSRGFLNMLKPSTSNQSQPQSPSTETSSPSGPGRRLKALRSMGSLRGKSSSSSSTPKTADTPPRVPQTLKVDVGLGLDTIDWVSVVNGKQDIGAPYSASAAESRPSETCTLPGYNRRAHGRRSISFGATTTGSSPSIPSSPFPPSTVASPPPSTHASSSASISATSSYQAALGNALIVASHAESSKGTHSDLLQILNHDQQPWGFSYTAYPHNVRVWYGDRDEKIAENAVRWMEKNMGEERCQVKVVKGADHGLMYRSSVVVDVLEHVRDMWTDDAF